MLTQSFATQSPQGSSYQGTLETPQEYLSIDWESTRMLLENGTYTILNPATGQYWGTTGTLMEWFEAQMAIPCGERTAENSPLAFARTRYEPLSEADIARVRQEEEERRAANAGR